jgi:hypothetical protein
VGEAGFAGKTAIQICADYLLALEHAERMVELVVEVKVGDRLLWHHRRLETADEMLATRFDHFRKRAVARLIQG